MANDDHPMPRGPWIILGMLAIVIGLWRLVA